jgi:DNA (cytosine-5)-methyltransferase 1
MNVLDLFSGIGGFSLGLERAGMRTVAFCERDEYCRAVLRKHWPGVPCFDDIHAIDADGLGRLGKIDLVCGGFPCQPFSFAGKQTGKEDDRYLWPEMCRVIALARPTWVIGENVAGLIAMALDDVLSDLEGLGYTARTFVIPAAAVGAPHRRDRLWIVATNANGQQHQGRAPANEWTPAAELPAYASSMHDGLRPSREGERQEQKSGDGDSARDVADADSIARYEGRQSYRAQGEGRRNTDRGGLGESDVENTEQSGREGRHSERGGSGAAMPSSWWSIEPDVGRVANGVPKRVDRLRCLGNAVVPQIPEIIGRAIMSNA